MGRLIDADKLKEHYSWWKGGSQEMTLDEAKRTFDTIVDLQPTVDAVPVVRCKDCKWWKTKYMRNGERKACVIEALEPVRNEDEYCSWAERREDAETKADRNGFVKQDDLFPQGR